MTRKLSLTDLNVRGKKVLMRVDFNVPLNKDGSIADDTRLVASLPSIQYVLDQGGSLILMSHLGRPKAIPTAEFSLKPCAERLSKFLNRPVKMANDSIGKDAQELVSNLKPGEIVLLENLRFYPDEEKPSEASEFTKQLAKFGDLYVNDAFGTAHRKHASTYYLAKYFPEKAAAGLLMEKEIEFLGKALLDPKRPIAAIVGGSKISTKIGVLKTLLKQVDYLLIGGAMTYTFMKAQGLSIGKSLYEAEFLNQAIEILEESKTSKAKLILPVDHLIADKMEETALTRIIENDKGIPDGFMGVDIGPITTQNYFEVLKKMETIFWNGPMGVFEITKFATGTLAIAEILAKSQAITIVGGGDSIAALQRANLADKIDHVSTGGGASLELVEFGTLPGIDVLTDKS
jgi:phosphoglycerate kinase